MNSTVTKPVPAAHGEHDPRVELVESIAVSHCFHSSARLREFLRYVSDCAIRNAPEEATEQQIGIHVFSRSAGYNSSEDSIVRTHARLLRQKLSEYFSDEGAHHTLVLEIPKGQYVPVFNARPHAPEPAAPPLAAVTPPVPEPAPVQRRPWFFWPSIGLAVVLSVLCGWLLLSKQLTPRSSTFDQFWKPFLAGDSSLVIYSNALFTGDSDSGLRYATPRDANAAFATQDLVDTYTGVGELESVYELTRLADSHHGSFTLKRSLLVTWDEAKLKNLIFIGSVAENPSLRDVTSTTEFTITTANGFSGIVNHNPHPGEPAIFQVPVRSATKDYSIFAYLPGVQPGRHMLIFSGLMTIGTQGAVDFACHRDTLEGLIRKATDAKGNVRPFEAVLETTIVGRVPLQTRLVAFHTR